MDRNGFSYESFFQRKPVKYMKSPLNYVGGKYKLLPQLIPLFPHRIETFADLFVGGCNVAVNVPAKQYLCNDLNTPIIELFQVFQSTPISSILEHIDANIQHYHLTKQNEEGFLALRAYYNDTRHPLDFYTLTCYSFNYQFRFNAHMEYNNPFGRDRSHFSDRMRKNLIAFTTKLQTVNMEFTSKNFRDISLDRFTPADFLYCDPPYLIASGTYNDGMKGFTDWNKEHEIALYDYLDRADARGLRFALSNILSHKGKENELLQRWCRKYRVIDLCPKNAQTGYPINKQENREVLIVNYGVDNGYFITQPIF